MEEDRFQYSKPLFYTFIISIIFCLVFICFALYILPPLSLSWRYNIPEFVFTWREWVSDYYRTTDGRAGAILSIFFLLLGIVSGLIAYVTGTHIEKGVLGMYVSHTNEIKEDVKATTRLSFKLLLILGSLVFVLLILNRLFLRP